MLHRAAQLLEAEFGPQWRTVADMLGTEGLRKRVASTLALISNPFPWNLGNPHCICLAATSLHSFVSTIADSDGWMSCPCSMMQPIYRFPGQEGRIYIYMKNHFFQTHVLLLYIPLYRTYVLKSRDNIFHIHAFSIYSNFLLRLNNI